jgi:hypothetical protein
MMMEMKQITHQMNKMIKAMVNKTKENMHKMIRARVIKVNMNNNMERKLLPQISSIYTHQFTNHSRLF